MNVHRNCYTVATHISEQELGTLCLAQMVPKGLLLVCKLPGHPLFFDAAANVLVVVVSLNQVQIVANRLDTIEVVGIGSVDDLAIAEMYLVAAVRHVVGQIKRNHITEAVTVHHAGLEQGTPAATSGETSQRQQPKRSVGRSAASRRRVLLQKWSL